MGALGVVVESKKVESENFIKSMEICQDAVARMSANSFKLKSWFLVVFTALFAFLGRTLSGETKYVVTVHDLIWLIPLMVFPVLDAFYLKHERVFRLMYNDFRDALNAEESSRKPFDLTPTEAQLKKYSLLNAVFSASIGWLYFPLLCAIQALIIYHGSSGNWVALMAIFPAMIVVGALVFKKETVHQLGY